MEPRTEHEIDYQIQQLAMAIDYYERAIDSSLYKQELEEYKQAIYDLNNQIKVWEAKRDLKWP